MTAIVLLEVMDSICLGNMHLSLPLIEWCRIYPRGIQWICSHCSNYIVIRAVLFYSFVSYPRLKEEPIGQTCRNFLNRGF